MHYVYLTRHPELPDPLLYIDHNLLRFNDDVQSPFGNW